MHTQSNHHFLKRNYLIIFITFLLVSFSDPYAIKRISDANFRYEFYVTEKIVTPQKKRMYYWFKGGLIHNSESGIAGSLLDGQFIKLYHSNQLAEQGLFYNGLKTGLWKTWYSNGILETTQYWRNGRRKGAFFHYDNTGQLLEKGRYSADQKQGKWIDYTIKDTITYKNGLVYTKPVQAPKPETAKEIKTAQKETGKRKDNFFTRLFHKKRTDTTKEDKAKKPAKSKNRKANGQGA